MGTSLLCLIIAMADIVISSRWYTRIKMTGQTTLEQAKIDNVPMMSRIIKQVWDISMLIFLEWQTW